MSAERDNYPKNDQDRHARYRAENREILRQKAQAYREANREQIRTYDRRAANARRAAMTEEEWQQLLARNRAYRYIKKTKGLPMGDNTDGLPNVGETVVIEGHSYNVDHVTKVGNKIVVEYSEL